MKNRKKKIAGATGIVALGLVAVGTFSWFSTTDRVANEFGMDAFDVALTEDFDTPDVPLTPGANVTKNVTVTNSGNVPVLVRVKLEEALSLLDMDGDKLKITYTNTATPADGQVAVAMSDEMIAAYKATAVGYTDYTTNAPTGITVLRKETTTGDNTVYSYIAYVTDTKQVVKLTPQGDDKSAPTGFDVEYAYHNYKDADTSTTDIDKTLTAEHGTGDTDLDAYYGSTFHDAVELHFADHVQTDGLALAAGTTWYLSDDGYFYYTKLLDGNSISDPLLESVEISENAGNALRGGHYTLTPVMGAAQKDLDAVKGVWNDIDYTGATAAAAVSANDEGQLVYNIVNSGTAYHA